MVIGVPIVKLQDQPVTPPFACMVSRVPQPLIFGSAMAADTAEEMPIPSARSLNVATEDEWLCAHLARVTQRSRCCHTKPFLTPSVRRSVHPHDRTASKIAPSCLKASTPGPTRWSFEPKRHGNKHRILTVASANGSGAEKGRRTAQTKMLRQPPYAKSGPRLTAPSLKAPRLQKAQQRP